MQGDPGVPRDVIDYVVFERHLVDPEKTRWRVLSKLPPQLPWKRTLELLSAGGGGGEKRKEKKARLGQGQFPQQKALTA